VNETKIYEINAHNKFPRFPADPAVIDAAVLALTTKSGRIDEVCQLLLRDPVSILEILSRANRQFHANEKPAIWSIKVALMRLGTEQTLKILSELRDESIELSSSVRHEFEKLRTRARKASQISRIIAEEVAPMLVDECQTATLMSEVGHMYALLRFKGRYVNVAETCQRKALAYRIEQELRLNVEKFRLDYLCEKWFPQALLFVFDSDIKCRTVQESALRFMVEAGDELLEAIDSHRFDRFIPPAELPAKCALRYLNISAAHRTRIADRIIEDFEPKLPIAEMKDPIQVEPVKAAIIPFKQEEPTKVIFFETKVEFIESSEQEFERPLNHFSEQNQKVLQALKALASIDVGNTISLIEEVLAVLTVDGPFKRASIIDFSPDSFEFTLTAQTGNEFELNQPMAVNSPFSPVATSSTQIRSYPGEGEVDALSPLGSNSFAISPLKGRPNQRMALYADCGAGGVVPFEARRVFRVAVGIINTVLPSDSQ
jgi:hypothetical protein